MHKTLLALLLLIPLFTGFTPTGSLSGLPLGTWSNFPCGPAPQNCQVCALGLGPAFAIPDTCELLNSTLHRTEPFIPTSQPVPQKYSFEIGCVSPATPTISGSVLYLQYANYSLTTYLNDSKFVTATGAASIYVDNTNGWPCPGNLQSGLQSVNAPPNGDGLIFRVMGICGCVSSNVSNAGTLRLSYVRLISTLGVQRSLTTAVATRSTTNFKWEAVTNLASVSAVTVNIDYLASNQTGAVGCGVASKCIQEGTASCVIAAMTTTCPLTTTTFTAAFTGTPAVALQVLNAPSIAFIQTGGYDFFETDLKT